MEHLLDLREGIAAAKNFLVGCIRFLSETHPRSSESLSALGCPEYSAAREVEAKETKDKTLSNES